jgi:fucose permease
VSAFLLSCLTYLAGALPASTLGLLWPSLRLSIHEPVSALGILLVVSVTASAASSALTGRVLSRAPAGPSAVGLLLPGGTALLAVALAAEAAAPSLWVLISGCAVFGVGFGVINSAVNVYAVRHFGARDINWVHASYALGATIGPLLVTGLLSSGLSWRWAFGSMAVVLALVTSVLAVGRRRWRAPPANTAGSRQASTSGKRRALTAAGERAHEQARAPGLRRRTALLGSLAFTAVETGIESAAGIWGYEFLTAGRGLPGVTAGAAVSAYWAMMLAGRIVFGPVAQRVGAARVLALAAVGVPLAAALMTMPGPGFIAVTGMMALGLAAAPVFPLVTMTTPDRVRDTGRTARMVGLQAAASAGGSAALPAGIGVLIGDVSTQALGPSLLVLGLAMCGVYSFSLRS